MKVHIYKSTQDGLWYWHARAENGRIVADSGEGYHNKGDMLQELKNLREQIGNAPIIEDETEKAPDGKATA